MEITESQLAFIREDIRNKGITLDSLADNLVDHICCALESHPISDFSVAYPEVISRFGNEGLAEIELQTRLLFTIKKEAQMKKGMYLIGFVALFLSTSGLLFKLQQWPGASILLVTGVLLINFGFLPLFLMDRYKRAVS